MNRPGKVFRELVGAFLVLQWMSTEKIYIRALDGVDFFMPVMVESHVSNSWRILPFSEYEADSNTVLFEFKPGDVVQIEHCQLNDQSALLAVSFAGSDPPLDFSQYLFRIVKGTLDTATLCQSKHYARLEESLSKREWHYPAVRDWKLQH